MYLRRLAAFGFIEDESASPLAIDVLSENGDILDTVTISRAGFEYLRRSLKFKREPKLDLTALSESPADQGQE